MSGVKRGSYVEVNGVSLVVYEKVSGLRAIPGTSLEIDLNRLTMGELAKAAALPGAWDYALPQSFFDEYLKRHGERPLGVWWYPPKDNVADGKYWLAGRFVDVNELLAWVGVRIEEQEEAVE